MALTIGAYVAPDQHRLVAVGAVLVPGDSTATSLGRGAPSWAPRLRATRPSAAESSSATLGFGMVDLWSVPKWLMLAAAGPALLAAVLHSDRP